MLSEALVFPLLTGGIILFAGCIQYFFPPGKINGLYGYRTANSMKSQLHWECAQRYSSKLLVLLGCILLLCAPLGFFLNWDEKLMMFVCLTALLIGIVFVIFCTERHLKNVIDEK